LDKMRPLRVLFVTNMWPDDERPWHGSFVSSQARSLERAGVSVDVLPIRGYASRGEYLKAAAAVVKLNRHCPYDVVHAHYGHSAVVARACVRAPLVISYCGSDVLGDPTATGSITRRTRVEAGVFKQVGRAAAATITKSSGMEQVLPQAVRARNHVIPNGVDLDRFRPIPRAEARRRLRWPVDEECVLFVGKPAKVVKNYPLAERVVERLARTRPRVGLRVAADVHRDEVPLWMSAADALLFTSRSEGSPNVIKEAMASELPIVATPVGDVPERLAGVDGCHVCEPDVDRMSAALADALDHGRSAAAREAVAPLSLDAVAARLIGVYHQVLGRPVEHPAPTNGRPGARSPVRAARM
jgi:glycosyltransferase involved in cell wall biosynthesis